jgi:large subunit ribosomal protein L23
VKRVTNVVVKPVMTEKGVTLGNAGKYIFRVNKNASKGAIANEVERLYGVNVERVKTMVMPGKKRRIAKTSQFTKTSSWKKAIVDLKKGQSIDFFAKG